MIPHLSRVKATRLNKSNRVIVWWGPVVPRHWVKRPPNWFHWRANSDLNPVFQRWKRAIDFRHSQFKTEMITILTVSDCTLHGKWVPWPTGSSFSLDWNLCCTSRREHKVTGQWAAAGNYGDRYLSLQVNEAVKMWEQLKEHAPLQPPAGCGQNNFCNTSTAAGVEVSEKKEPLSQWKGRIYRFGLGIVIGLITLDRHSKSIDLGRRLFLAR